jgi:hypothetical protein
MSSGSLFNHSIKNVSGLASIKVLYVEAGKPAKNMKINIYKDDTCKDVILKLSSLQKNTTSEHIFAWYKEDGENKPLGFSYPIEIDTPYQNKKLDNRFITDDMNRILVTADKTNAHMLIENFNSKTIYYTTVQAFLNSFNLSDKSQITDEECMEKTKYKCIDFYNGKLVKYWPLLTYEQMRHISKETRVDKLKIERNVVSLMLQQCDFVYSSDKLILPEEFETPLLSISNNNEGNTVQLGRLFTDIKLGEIKGITIPFSKITLDDYKTRYCKLLKEAIVISTVNEQRYITKDLLLKWFRDQITSLPSGGIAKHLDETNSVVFKLYNNTNYVSLIIYGTGEATLLLHGHSVFLTHDYITDMIKMSNTLLTYLNKQKIFSEKPIGLIDESYQNSLQYTAIQFLYPVKNYKQDLFIRFIKNMNTFVRFNKIQDTKLFAVYKRVNQYGQSIASVLSSLQRSKQNLTRDEMISELERLFNISNDEAVEEYENWEMDPSSKFVKGGEEGCDIVIDLSGTNIRVDVTGVRSYPILTRIYQFINTMITYYEKYMISKSDPQKLFNLPGYSNPSELLETQEVEQELAIQNQVDEILSEEEPVSEERVITSDRESLEEQIQRTIDSASDTSEPLRLESEESSLAESEDYEMERLDDSDSSGGGYRGGYNVNRYYLNRLQKYDNDLFKKHPEKLIPRKNSFAVKCAPNIGRQPVAILKKDLDRYNQTDEGEGVAFSEALYVEGRGNPTADNTVYYICPKYWDIKDERPRDPSKLHEFSDVVIDNKMSTSEKKNTDNYVLVRDERGYWDQAGNDIERYRIEMLKGSHPEGFDVPCCNAPRKGANKFSKGWDVDIFVYENGKYQWKKGKVKSSTKTHVNVIQGGKVKSYPIGNVRRHKSSDTLVYSFPLDQDTYGHIDPIIKQLVNQPLDYPIKAHNIGLVRKGVYRGGVDGDNSILESLAEILHETNRSSEELVKHINYDLRKLYRSNKNIIMTIAGGGFINKFKMESYEFTELEKTRFIGTVKKEYPSVKQRIDNIQEQRVSDNQPRLDNNELFTFLIESGATKDRLLIYNEMNIISSIIQFGKYITDKSEIVTDEYIIPVLHTISQRESTTFGPSLPNLSIVVFEGVGEDVIITPPIGNFNSEEPGSLIMLYKQRRNMYEPILYRKHTTEQGTRSMIKYEEEIGILYPREQGNFFNDQNTQINYIIKQIYNKTKTLPNVSLELIEEKLKDLNLDILNYIYDSYYKIVYIKTNKNVMIPVDPSPIKETMLNKLTYLSYLRQNDLPKYDDVIDILKRLDSKLDTPLLPNHTYTVVNESIKSVKLIIKELVFPSNVYIPIRKETFDSKKHKAPISSSESYFMVDQYIGLNLSYEDSRITYLKQSEYFKTIQRLFFQKVYLEIKDDSEITESVHKIKDHPIMMRLHKSDKIHELLEPYAKRVTKVVEEPVTDYNLFEEDNKLIIRSLYEKNTTNSDDPYQYKTIQASLIFHKLLRLMIECILNYTTKDYERFLQLDINLSKLRQSMTPDELLFSHKDIVDDNYLEYFIRKSRFIRNFTLHDEPIQDSKLIQVHRLKDKVKQTIVGDFRKQYPQILHKKLGRKIDLISYKNSEYTESNVLYLLLNELYRDSEITMDLLDSIVGTNKLTKESIDTLVDNDKFRNICICLISRATSKKYKHDIFISQFRHIPEQPMIVIYQTEDTLVHVKKREGEFTRQDITLEG